MNLVIKASPLWRNSGTAKWYRMVISMRASEQGKHPLEYFVRLWLGISSDNTLTVEGLYKGEDYYEVNTDFITPDDVDHSIGLSEYLAIFPGKPGQARVVCGGFSVLVYGPSQSHQQLLTSGGLAHLVVLGEDDSLTVNN